MDEVAIFWDYENVRVVAKGINIPLAEALITYSESLGHPRVKKVYADWAGINKEIILLIIYLFLDQNNPATFEYVNLTLRLQ